MEEESALRNCRFLRNSGFWAGPGPPTPEEWLENFDDPAERELAAHLLSGLEFLSEKVCIQLLKHSVLAVQRDVCAGILDLADRQQCWRTFLSRAFLTIVQGEKPNPVDSGYHYIRAARQHLEFPEENLVEPEVALQRWQEGAWVVFLDDFVGSGEQLLATLRASRRTVASFESLASTMPKKPLYYCPLIATQAGAQRIRRRCSYVRLLPLFELDDSYAVLSPNSRLWGQGDRQQGIAMIQRVALAKGIRQAGFHGLSLALAFHNSTPDACLPALYTTENGWKPLVRRS